MKSRRVALVAAMTGILVALLGASLGFRQQIVSGYIPPIEPPQILSELPILYEVPAFQLTDSNGQPFDSASLKGDVWVAEFMFTSCPGICPTMTAEMKKIFAAFPDAPEFKIVSVSVDPNIDTPEVLAKYAQSHGTESDRWHRLTGDSAEILKLSSQGFKVGSMTNPLDHSSNFILVDRQGNIRGYYDSLEPDKMTALIEDIKKLL